MNRYAPSGTRRIPYVPGKSMNTATIAPALLALLAGVCGGLAAPAAAAPPRWDRPPTVAEAPAGNAPGECSEGFEDVESLFAEGGWLRRNTSTLEQEWDQALMAGKGSRWEQKIEYLDSNVEGLFFNAHAGTPHSVIFTSLYAHSVLMIPGTGTGTGVLSNWLVTPEITFRPGMRLSFWTRKGFYEYAPIWADAPDRMVVRLCTTGDCSDVGTGPHDTGAFTTTLLTINPQLGMNDDPAGLLGYPYNGWRQFTLTDLPASGTGRIAFQYYVTGAMDVEGAFSGVGNGNMIALDSVELHGAGACPLRATPLFADGFEPGAPRSITQNTGTFAPVDGLVATCVAPTSWLRRFDLDGEFGLDGRVSVDSVDFAVERSYSTVPVEVRLYAIPNEADFVYANLEQIGARTITVDQNDRLSIRTVAVTGTVPDAATHDLVVEIRKNEFHREFYVGFNAQTQTAPSYMAFRGDNCGDHPEPTDMENIGGAPDASLLLRVNLADPAAETGSR